MRVISLALILIVVNLPFKIFAQLIEDNFDYPLGTLTSVSSNWSESPTGSVDIQVINGNLSFSGYASSGIGKMIFLNGGATRSGVKRIFSKIIGNGNVVYFSFLISVKDSLDLNVNSSSGDYFANFQTVSGKNRAYVYIRKGSSKNTVNIGLAKSSSSSLQWYGNNLNIGSTILLVVAYVFQSGNDAVKLWVNPNLAGAEPPADLSITSGTDADTLCYVQFRQRSYSGNIYADGVRVGTTWFNAPLPVELTSFYGFVKNNTIELRWNTATEIDNEGFEIQKCLSLMPYSRWQKIGFVLGRGISNSPTNYCFTDSFPNAVNYYRLKQVDLSGNYEFSKIIRVNFTNLKFKLFQNYPNPFNPCTTIIYEIRQREFVNLSIFDALGRKIYELINRFENPGIHKAYFKASNLSAGVYIYRLRAGGFIQTKRMVILK